MLTELVKENSRKFAKELEEALDCEFRKIGYIGKSQKELIEFVESNNLKLSAICDGHADRYVCFDMTNEKILFELRLKKCFEVVEDGVVGKIVIIKTR